MVKDCLSCLCDTVVKDVTGHKGLEFREGAGAQYIDVGASTRQTVSEGRGEDDLAWGEGADGGRGPESEAVPNHG